MQLLQPKFASYLTQEQREKIRAKVQSVVDLLAEIAIDDRHGPKLYSRFLEKLLARPMAKLDPTSPNPSSNSSPPPPSRVKPSRPTRPFHVNGQAPSFKTPVDYNNFIRDCPSPTTSSSLSPPPTEAALSFDQFAPVGGIDPFAPNNNMLTSDASNASSIMGELFQPSLPFDEDIVQSMQSMSDPNGWQDISLPGNIISNFHLHTLLFKTGPPSMMILGFDWMAQFQQNLGIDMNDPSTIYDSDMTYLTGPTK